jgi:hypothetical protein
MTRKLRDQGDVSVVTRGRLGLVLSLAQQNPLQRTPELPEAMPREYLSVRSPTMEPTLLFGSSGALHALTQRRPVATSAHELKEKPRSGRSDRMNPCASIRYLQVPSCRRAVPGRGGAIYEDTP